MGFDVELELLHLPHQGAVQQLILEELDERMYGYAEGAVQNDEADRRRWHSVSPSSTRKAKVQYDGVVAVASCKTQARMQSGGGLDEGVATNSVIVARPNGRACADRRSPPGRVATHSH